MAAWSLTFELFVNAVYGMIARRLTTLRLIGLIVCSAIVLIWIAIVNDGIGGGNNQDNFAYGFGRVIFPFFAGVLLYRLRLPQRQVPWVGPAILLGLPLLLRCTRDALPASSNLLLFPLIIATGAMIEVGPRLAGACRLAGTSSYRVYILQGHVLRAGGEFLRYRHLDLIGFYMLGTALTAVVLAISYAAT